MTITLFIQILICFKNNEKISSLFVPTTSQLYQKQFYRFGGMALTKMQTIVIYSGVRIIIKD